MRNLLVRKQGVSDDLAKYDHANFVIATEGMPGSSYNMGELWVSYTVELIAPRSEDPVQLLAGPKTQFGFTTPDIARIDVNTMQLNPGVASWGLMKNTMRIELETLGDGRNAFVFSPIAAWFRVSVAIDLVLGATAPTQGSVSVYSPDGSITFDEYDPRMNIYKSSTVSASYRYSALLKLSTNKPKSYLRICFNGPNIANVDHVDSGFIEIASLGTNFGEASSSVSVSTLAERKRRALIAMQGLALAPQAPDNTVPASSLVGTVVSAGLADLSLGVASKAVGESTGVDSPEMKQPV